MCSCHKKKSTQKSRARLSRRISSGAGFDKPLKEHQQRGNPSALPFAYTSRNFRRTFPADSAGSSRRRRRIYLYTYPPLYISTVRSRIQGKGNPSEALQECRSDKLLSGIWSLYRYLPPSFSLSLCPSLEFRASRQTSFKCALKFRRRRRRRRGRETVNHLALSERRSFRRAEFFEKERQRERGLLFSYLGEEAQPSEAGRRDGIVRNVTRVDFSERENKERREPSRASERCVSVCILSGMMAASPGAGISTNL